MTQKKRPAFEKLLKGYFAHEDKIHELIQESILLGREQREILLAAFARFCRFSKGAFCRKSPILTGRNDRLKPDKLLNLI